MATLPYLTGEPQHEAEWFQALIDLARYLRTPEGCPWDREQDAYKFAQFAAGEMTELVEAIESGDNAHAAEEFGDVFFTLLASAAAAEEEGRFKLGNALAAAHAKMVRRHDHVFGENKAATAQDAIDAWNRIKAEEKMR